MPQRRASFKALRQNIIHHDHNLEIKKDLKKTIKDFLQSVEQKNSNDAKSNLKIAYKKLDKAAKRNIISKNTSSRRKSRLAKLAKNLAS